MIPIPIAMSTPAEIGAVALIIGVKTAARFPQFEHGERFVEYYLIGTLLSLSIVLATALVARALLDLPLLG